MILPSLDPCLEMDVRPRVETFGSRGVMQRFGAQLHKALPQVLNSPTNDVFFIYCVLSKVPGDELPHQVTAMRTTLAALADGRRRQGCRHGIFGWVRCTWPVDTVRRGEADPVPLHLSPRKCFLDPAVWLHSYACQLFPY